MAHKKISRLREKDFGMLIDSAEAFADSGIHVMNIHRLSRHEIRYIIKRCQTAEIGLKAVGDKLVSYKIKK